MASHRWCACCSASITVRGSYRADGKHGAQDAGNATLRYCDSCGDPSAVEFSIDRPNGTRRPATFDAACGFAAAVALSTGETVTIDICIQTRSGAHAFGCLEDYDADPEASVTKRITINATDLGRVA